MKELFVIRHAKAGWFETDCSDFERPLDAHGMQESLVMASRLHAKGIVPDLIYASAAKRARTTAEQLAGVLCYPSERIVLQKEIYTAGRSELLKLISSSPEQINRCFLVGHNPVITELAEWLTETSFGLLPTCAVVGITLVVDTWRNIFFGAGKVSLYDYPQKLSQKDSTR